MPTPMKPELTAVTIVLLGRFSPADFDLRRLESSKAVAKAEIKQSEYELLVPDQAVGVVFPWGKLTVVPERMVVETAQVPYVRVADLALKLTREISPTSLIAKFGINVTSHYKFQDVGARDRFASRLAPTPNWGAFGQLVQESFRESGDKHGGLMRVTMRQALPPGRSAGWLDITVEPSPALPRDVGVAVMANDHFETSEEDLERFRNSARAVSDMLLDQLASNFDKSIERSFDVFNGLVVEASQ